MFWVFYLFLYLLYVLSPFLVIQVQLHCCICPRSKVLIWGRTYNFWFSEPGWPRSEWCSPVPSIYLKMIRFHFSSRIGVIDSWFDNPFSRYVDFDSFFPVYFDEKSLIFMKPVICVHFKDINFYLSKNKLPTLIYEDFILNNHLKSF
jgi:hypothetical protein